MGFSPGSASHAAEHHLDTRVLEHLVERPWELPVPIPDQTASPAAGALEVHDEILRSLDHPGRGRARSRPGSGSGGSRAQYEGGCAGAWAAGDVRARRPVHNPVTSAHSRPRTSLLHPRAWGECQLGRPPEMAISRPWEKESRYPSPRERTRRIKDLASA